MTIQSNRYFPLVISTSEDKNTSVLFEIEELDDRIVARGAYLRNGMLQAPIEIKDLTESALLKTCFDIIESVNRVQARRKICQRYSIADFVEN